MIIRRPTVWHLAMALGFWASASATAATYNESGGLVIMEMENTTSPLGLWKKRNGPLNGFTGSGYLEFTGNTPTNGPATSPLTYKFKISKAGLYHLHLHCARDTTHGQPADHSNDCYVRVDGDYSAGPNAGDSHGDDAPLNVLKANTKFFGGAADRFAWASGNRLDLGGHNNKRVAAYDFKAGNTYTLVVHGRSQWFSVNRIVFRHKDSAVSLAQNLGTPESVTTGGGPSTPDNPSPPNGPSTPTGPTSESYKVFQRLYGNPDGTEVSKSHEAYQKTYGDEAGQNVSKSYEIYQKLYGNPDISNLADTARQTSESFKVFIRVWGHLIPTAADNPNGP